MLVVGGGLTGLATASVLARAGRDVTVLEARRIGSGTTGHSTAKVSLLQGSILQRMRAHRSANAVAAYVRANAAGQRWLIDVMSRHERPVHRCPAVTYAVTDAGADRVAAETRLARRTGLDVVVGPQVGLPFPVRAALTLDDQVQLDPLDLLDALRTEVEQSGGRVLERVRVTGMSWARDPWVVHTDAGQVRADHVVLATGTPVIDRTMHVLVSEPQRSYAAAYACDPMPIGAMYLSVDDEARSLRSGAPSVPGLLIVGGNNHRVGRAQERDCSSDLDGWARAHFAVGPARWAWSAQDYRLPRHAPSVGSVPGTDGRLLVATGYDKWGMTNAAAAAQVLGGLVTGEMPEWHTAYGHDRVSASDLAAALRTAGHSMALLGIDRAAVLGHSSTRRPPEGRAQVVGPAHAPVGVSTVDGTTRRVSAVCPHRGGVLAWNDAELSWDCPLHGSRFTAGGELIEGPATCGLAAVDAPPSSDDDRPRTGAAANRGRRVEVPEGASGGPPRDEERESG